DWGDNFPAKIIPLGQPLSNRPCDAGRMNKKETFIKAVQILAPDDQIIYQAARRVSEEGLPAAPGGAALEFVVAMQRMRAPAWPCKTRFKSCSRRTDAPSACPVAHDPIALKHALKIKSAEFWLKLGQPDQALLEIKSLPERLQKHPSVIKAHLAVVRASRELSESSQSESTDAP